MQLGTVTRHGRGWRGYWREDGKCKATSTYERKGEAREALNREFDRIKLGASYRAPITLRELADRWLAQYGAAPQTVEYAPSALKRLLAAPGYAQHSGGDLQKRVAVFQNNARRRLA